MDKGHRLLGLGAALLAAAAALAVSAGTSSGDAGAGVQGVPVVPPAAVGPLFELDGHGRLDGHFCTASVVAGAGGDLVLTAAHCVANRAPGSFAFVPAYEHGVAPLGVWTVQKILVDDAWSSSGDPDHDFAFLVVGRKGSHAPLEAYTGAERLGGEAAVGKLAEVVGYPSAADRPIGCRNTLVAYSTTQIEFDCGGYAVGTSGSPLVVDADPATGLGTVVGVIGGYEQGGDTPDVSYASSFAGAVGVLYARALVTPAAAPRSG